MKPRDHRREAMTRLTRRHRRRQAPGLIRIAGRVALLAQRSRLHSTSCHLNRIGSRVRSLDVAGPGKRSIARQISRVPLSPPFRTAPAYYGDSIGDFLTQSPNEILGRLASSHSNVDLTQRRAWQIQTEVLRSALSGLEGTVYLEFGVPRLGSRIDVVVVSGCVVFPIEFKCGEQRYHAADYNQAWDYALDLKNFHEGSHEAEILPILVATDAETEDVTWDPRHADGVRPPLRCGSRGLRRALEHGLSIATGARLDGVQWGLSRYRPTPTIIEAARALYDRHSVDAIARHDAGSTNLSVTSTAINDLIERARQNREKAIVFVTGVPGSGKTRVGLDIATKRRDQNSTHAMFLSGNQPLVAVLQEALVRDEVAREKAKGVKVRKGGVHQKVKAFIQNVHHFRDDGLRNPSDAPVDHVVIFDEAQRAWNLRKTADFMRQRKGRADFQYSEPEFLISYMDRHDDWAIIVCLVGSGQEIHTGEAGIVTWLEALRARFQNWRIFVAPDLSQAEHGVDDALADFRAAGRLEEWKDLHLSTSVRSFRTDKVSAFIHAVLAGEAGTAERLLREVTRYPMAVTRSLATAKDWIRGHARGTERYGLVASSEAQRLKPHAVDVRVQVNPIHWFLNGPNDTRSSYYLEDAATEFQIQGLELDWICMTWDADLRMLGDQWHFHSFRGDQWTKIRSDDGQRYLLNAYRVLLTRARQGMVIFVPPGDTKDATRHPDYYDETFEYLQSLGVRVV